MRVSEEKVFLQDFFTLVPPTTLKREEVVRLVLLRVPRTTDNLMLAGLVSYWTQEGGLQKRQFNFRFLSSVEWRLS